MKFTHTQAQVKEVGSNAVAFSKATVALTKSVVKVPVALGRDISEDVKRHTEYRKAYKDWLAQQET